LLKIIMRDKTWDNDVARKTYVAILELMTALEI
jgi:putative thioredoxin